MSFDNKVVIVTGAGAGIGEAIAKRFTQLLGRVALVDRNEDNLNRVIAECEGGTKRNLVIVADLSKEEAVNSVVSKTVERFGRLDVLVNCAGIIVNENILGDDLGENFDLLMSINLKAPMILTSKAAPYLVENKGNIVNISSVRAGLPAKKAFLYCSSKAALEMFTKCMAVEFADDGVRANSVHPGFVRTKIYHSANPDLNLKDIYEDVEKKMPFGVIEPEEVAKLVSYLASDDARSITGSSHYMDGGLLLLAKKGVEEN